MHVELECTQCKALFYRSKGEVNRINKIGQKFCFCSRSCKNLHQGRNKLHLKCFHCEIPFTRNQFAVQENVSKKFYCSHSCKVLASNANRPVSEETKRQIKTSIVEPTTTHLSIAGLGEIVCPVCKKSFRNVSNRRKYCSTECFRSTRMTFKRTQLSNRTWQKMFKRAFPDWRCPYCSWTETFDVHHIISKKDGGDNNLENLILLCPNHHSLITRNVWNPDDLSRYAVSNHYALDDLRQFYGSTNSVEDFKSKFLATRIQ